MRITETQLKNAIMYSLNESGFWDKMKTYGKKANKFMTDMVKDDDSLDDGDDDGYDDDDDDDEQFDTSTKWGRFNRWLNNFGEYQDVEDDEELEVSDENQSRYNNILNKHRSYMGAIDQAKTNIDKANRDITSLEPIMYPEQEKEAEFAKKQNNKVKGNLNRVVGQMKFRDYNNKRSYDKGNHQHVKSYFDDVNNYRNRSQYTQKQVAESLERKIRKIIKENLKNLHK